MINSKRKKKKEGRGKKTAPRNIYRIIHFAEERRFGIRKSTGFECAKWV